MTVTTGMSISGKMSVGVVDDGRHAEDQDQQRHHDERVGPAQGEPNDPHDASFLLPLLMRRLCRTIRRRSAPPELSARRQPRDEVFGQKARARAPRATRRLHQCRSARRPARPVSHQGLGAAANAARADCLCGRRRRRERLHERRDLAVHPFRSFQDDRRHLERGPGSVRSIARAARTSLSIVSVRHERSSSIASTTAFEVARREEDGAGEIRDEPFADAVDQRESQAARD